MKEQYVQQPVQEPKKRFDWKHTVITVVLVLFSAGVVGGGTWYYMDQSSRQDADTIKSLEDRLSLVTPTAKETSTTAPNNFSKVTLNGTDVYYPTSWGTPKTSKQVTSVKSNVMESTFGGEYATFDKPADVYMAVTDSSAYKDYPDMQKVVTYLDKVYKEKRINPEEVYDASYLPVLNAANTAYNPRYLESGNKSWRGFWYIANIGQDVNASINFVSVMSNNNGKILTLHGRFESTRSVALQDQLNKASMRSNEQVLSWQFDNSKYLNSAYIKDTEVANKVNNEFLQVCNLVK